MRVAPLVKGPRRIPVSSLNTKQEHSVLDCLPACFSTIMSFPWWPISNVHPLSSYVKGVIAGVGPFHLQNPLDIIRCLLKATSALM